MNISSTNSVNAILGQISTANVSNKSSTPIKESARMADANKSQEQSFNQATPNIVIDEQAITMFKENQAAQLAFLQPKGDKFSTASQDQPLAKNQIAVSQYQAISNLSERESVQKLFGVDLLA